MKFKIIPVILVLVVLINSATTFAADQNTTSTSYRVAALQEKLSTLTQADIDNALKKFSDMGKHWSRKYAGILVALDITNGIWKGTFKPDNKINIDEFIALTVRALGFKPETGSGNWADPYIKIAKDEKLIDTKEFTDFKKPILREQAVRIIVKATMLNETTPNSNIYNYIRDKIKDYPTITDSYKQHVLEAYAIGLVSGASGGNFLPKNTLSRAEASSIIARNVDKTLRTPLKPDARELLVLKDIDGKSYEIYPSNKPETFKTAVALNKDISQSKGYSFLIYNPFEQIISGCFYQSKDSYTKSDYNIQMAINIYTLDDKAIDHPYQITIYKPKEVKDLHRNVITKLFQNLFEKDADKAISSFDRYLGLSLKSGAATENTYTYNNRKVLFYIVENETKFTVWIYSKGK